MYFKFFIKFFFFSALINILCFKCFSQACDSKGSFRANELFFELNHCNQNDGNSPPVTLSSIEESFQLNFKNQYLFDLISCQSVKDFYCDTCSAKSNLMFVIGSKKSNGLEIFHQQKLGGLGKFLLDFSTKSSIGFFQREGFKNIFFKPRIVLMSANKKYNFRAGYEANKFLRELNGGLTSDSLFLSTKNLSANLNPINLRLSESALKNKTISFSNSYSFYKTKPDAEMELRYKLKEVFVKSKLDYSIVKYGFYSQDRNFFDKYFLDTIATRDTLSLKSLIHSLGCGIEFGSNSVSLIAMPYFLNGQFEYKNLGEKSEYQSYSVGVELNYRNRRRELIGEFLYQNDYVAEFSENQNLVKGSISKSITKKYWVYAGMSFSENFSPLLTRRYFSNNFIWSNDFNNEREIVLTTGFTSLNKRDVLNLKYSVINNYIYFNSLAVPDEYKNEFSRLSVDLSKEIFLDRFTFIPKVKYTSISNSKIYHYPEFVFNPEFIYTNDAFNGKLNFSTGIRFFYFSSFYADAYMPVTDKYYLQSEIKTGNYPMFNFFMKFNIKRAELFVELNHFNEGLSGKNYFLTPHYPMPGRSLFFGINWQLIN